MQSHQEAWKQILTSIKSVNEFGAGRTKVVQDVMPRIGKAAEIAQVA